MIAANQVNIEGIGFESEDNALSVFWAEGSIELPRCSKPELARKLIDVVVERYRLYQNLIPHLTQQVEQG